MSPKEKKERWVMDLFLEVYNQPLRILSKQESPDFILEYNRKIIGVELTEVFQDSNLGKSALQQFSSVSNTFTEELISLIQPHVIFKFSIGIRFNKKILLRKSTKHAILQKTKDVCVPFIQHLNNREHLELDYHSHKLPSEIESIYITRWDAYEESYNSRPEGGIVNKLTIEYLQPILNRKHKKIAKYTKCDNYWLLIREGNYYAGSFSDIEINPPIRSFFDKVFIIRTRTKEMIELK